MKGVSLAQFSSLARLGLAETSISKDEGCQLGSAHIASLAKVRWLRYPGWQAGDEQSWDTGHWQLGLGTFAYAP